MSHVIDDVVPARGAGTTLPLLREVTGFGTNPGQLKMRLFVPEGHSRRRPLVVVLHGCRQSADVYAAASGWMRLGGSHDFMVMFPEQQVANNNQRCFSWFEPGEGQRGGAELESIRQMIEAAVADHGADKRRVFICGLSAGGAMTGAILATHPRLFRAGAIIAGLPYGAASNMSEAFESMSRGRIKDAKTWGDLVRHAAGDAPPAKNGWPSVAVWHGTADSVVRPINAGELVKQWTNVHGIGAEAPEEDSAEKVTRRIWRDESGRACVTEYAVSGLAHGAPVDDPDPPAPFFLPAGISSTARIADDWGLTSGRPRTFLSMFGL